MHGIDLFIAPYSALVAERAIKLTYGAFWPSRDPEEIADDTYARTHFPHNHGQPHAHYMQ
jgi:hypothetical protein